jgi:hypothetical protein
MTVALLCFAQGLRNRDITWAYLFSDNFLRTATYSWVPLQYVLEALEFTVLPAEVKVRTRSDSADRSWAVR